MGRLFHLGEPLVSPARNITGSATPAVAPADVTTNTTLEYVVRGEGFGTRASQPSDLQCRLKVPDFEEQTVDPLGPASVINDTAIRCSLPGFLFSTSGVRYGIVVESPSHSDPAKHQWWSHGAADLQLRTLVEVAPDRRPYLSAELAAAELLVAVNIGALAAIPRTAAATAVTICAELTARSLFNPGPNPYLPKAAVLPAALEGLVLLPCKTFPLAGMTGGQDTGDDHGSSGPFNTSIFAVRLDAAALAKLPDRIAAANLKVDVTVGEGALRLPLAPKYRRFAVAPSADRGPGSVSVVDHRRRMIMVNGKPWLGVGFYVDCPLESDTGTFAPDVAKRTFAELSREGMTQIMPYGLDALDPADRAAIVEYLDTDLNATVMFDMPLVADVVAVLNSTVDSVNYTAAWSRLTAKIESVKDSKSLLGYYICDDCDNAKAFPADKMAHLYVAIKEIDPFHVVAGAPWAEPWSLYQYGDDAGAVSLDYAQVENYIADPAYHQGWDERIRTGMFWEPIANSPPSYILEGDNAEGLPNTGPVWPPVLESTLSWLGVIEFGAVNVVNFVIAPQRSPATGRALNMPAHINAQGNYARAARKLLPALLPDLTDPVASKPLTLSVSPTGSRCPQEPTLPTYNGRPAVNFDAENPVVAKGARQRWLDPETGVPSFCAFIIVANLCPAPSTYAIGLDVDEIPGNVTQATHQFDANYNVSIAEVWGVRWLNDAVAGYGTSVLRIGCEGWTEACDGTGRVC